MEDHTSPSSAGSFSGFLEMKMAGELALLKFNKAMNTDGIHPRVPRELLGVFAGLLTSV